VSSVATTPGRRRLGDIQCATLSARRLISCHRADDSRSIGWCTVRRRDGLGRDVRPRGPPERQDPRRGREPPVVHATHRDTVLYVGGYLGFECCFTKTYRWSWAPVTRLSVESVAPRPLVALRSPVGDRGSPLAPRAFGYRVRRRTVWARFRPASLDPRVWYDSVHHTTFMIVPDIRCLERRCLRYLYAPDSLPPSPSIVIRPPRTRHPTNEHDIPTGRPDTDHRDTYRRRPDHPPAPRRPTNLLHDEPQPAAARVRRGGVGERRALSTPS
jgi:hypothetical protein